MILKKNMVKSVEYTRTWKMRFIMLFFRSAFDLLDEFKIELQKGGK